MERDAPAREARLPFRQRVGRTRYIVAVAVAGTFLSSVALLVYEALVVAQIVADLVRDGVVLPKAAKTLAVGLIEAVDVFLIAIALYVISLGLYTLFIDDRIVLPKWLEIHDLEDLKRNLVSLVIAVLAVLFLREAVAWDGSRDILALGGALGLVIAALTYYLSQRH
jgi:uncharacterized membrane protein YqhA